MPDAIMPDTQEDEAPSPLVKAALDALPERNGAPPALNFQRHGRRTSIRLDAEFVAALDEIIKREEQWSTRDALFRDLETRWRHLGIKRFRDHGKGLCIEMQGARSSRSELVTLTNALRSFVVSYFRRAAEHSGVMPPLPPAEEEPA